MIQIINSFCICLSSNSAILALSSTFLALILSFSTSSLAMYCFNESANLESSISNCICYDIFIFYMLVFKIKKYVFFDQSTPAEICQEKFYYLAYIHMKKIKNKNNWPPGHFIN